MDEEELDMAKGSPLKLLTLEDLEIHSVQALKDRATVLKDEVDRTLNAINNKNNAQVKANSIFKG